MSYSLEYIIKLGVANSGLSLRANLYDINDSLSISGISTNFSEIFQGDYKWYYTNFPDSFRGYAKITDSLGNYLTAVGINPEEAEYTNYKTSSISGLIPTISGIDSYLSNQHGNSLWGSSLTGNYIVDIYTKDQSSNPIGETKVEIYPSGFSNLIGLSTSNTSTGKSTFNLNAGSYSIYSYNNLVATWDNPYYLTVSANTSVNLLGTSFVAPVAPSDPSLCRLYTWVQSLGLTPEENIELQVIPTDPQDRNETVAISTRIVKSKSNAAGYVFADVGSGLNVRVKIPKALVDLSFTVPTDRNNFNLAELID